MRKVKEKQNEEKPQIISNSIIPVPVEDVEPSPFEFQEVRRETYTDDSLMELGNSIKSSIQIEPALVRWNPVTKKYQLISGERRWRAVQMVGLPTLECVVRQLTDVQALEIQYKENHDRQDNDPLVDAFLFKHLHQKEQFSISEIADRFNLKRKDVLEMILLNDLIQEAKIQLTKKLLPKKHALLIASFKPNVQEEIIARGCAYRGNSPENRPVPFELFEEIIEDNFGRKLADAPFDTEDGSLHIRGLKCSFCTENSVNQPDLFGGRFDGEAACLNSECFQLKTTAFFRLQREAAAAKMPNPEQKPIEELAKEIPIVATRPTTETVRGEKVIHTPVIETPECEFSTPAIIGDGERRNQSAWTCQNENCEIHFPKAKRPVLSDHERQKLEDRFNMQVSKQVREKVFAQAIEFFDDYKPFWIYDDLISDLILRMWNDCGYDVQAFIFPIIKKWRNCPSNHQCAAFEIFIKSLKKTQQSRLLFLLTYKLEGFYSNSSKDGVKRIAKDFALLDYKLLDAKIRHELAPAEHRAKTEDYLGHVENGFDIEIPVLWTHKEDAE